MVELETLKRLNKEKLVTLALLVSLSQNGKVCVADYYDKLYYLLFLIAYGVFDKNGQVIGVRTKPRINLEFRIGEF